MSLLPMHEHAQHAEHAEHAVAVSIPHAAGAQQSCAAQPQLGGRRFALPLLQARASRPAGPPQFPRFMPPSLIHSSRPTMNEPSFPRYLSSHFSRLRASAPAPLAEGAA